MRFELDGAAHDLRPVRRGAPMEIAIDGRVHRVEVETGADRRLIICVDGTRHRVTVAGDGERIFVHAFGRAWEVRAVDPLSGGRGAASAADRVAAPMPGTVLSVHAAAGEKVAEGDPILVIESMKLETTISAPHDAVVAELPLGPGATFDKGALLARFEVGGEDGSDSGE